MTAVAFRKSQSVQVAALLVSVLAMLVTQIYYALVLTPYNLDFNSIVFGVFLPLSIGSILLILTEQWFFLFSFLGYSIPIVDDVPIKFDWPRVHGFPPGVSHDQMQNSLYVLSFACLLLAMWLAGRGKKPGGTKAVLAYLLLPAIFLLNYVGDLPFDWATTLENQYWYQLDITQHLLSLGVFVVAVMLAQGRPLLSREPSEPPPI